MIDDWWWLSPWKVLKFLFKSLKSSWIFFNFQCNVLESVFNAFGCSRQNINHSSENLKVIYVKLSLFYAIIIIHKTSELKNVEKVVKQVFQALKSCYIDWECAFLYNLWNYIPVRWSLKIECGPYKVLEKWLQSFCMTPETGAFSTGRKFCVFIYDLFDFC